MDGRMKYDSFLSLPVEFVKKSTQDTLYLCKTHYSRTGGILTAWSASRPQQASCAAVTRYAQP